MRGGVLLAASALAAAPLFVAPDSNAETAQIDNPRGSLCARGEVVIFHCPVGRKMVSVCGGQRPTPHAQYRFGVPGDIELAFPGPGQTGLSVAIESYSGGGAQQIRFANGGYDYAAYSRTVRTGFGRDGLNRPSFSDGVMVRRNGRLVANRACTTAMRSDAAAQDYMSPGEIMEWFD